MHDITGYEKSWRKGNAAALATLPFGYENALFTRLALFFFAHRHGIEYNNDEAS